MNKYIIIILLLLTSNIHAQKQDEAITIENNVFVFSETNLSSDTIYTLQKNEIFLLAENEETNSDWVYGEIPRSKLSKMIAKSEGFYKYQDFFISGFVPKSKIFLVDSLSKYNNKDVALKFMLARADTSQTIAENNMRYGLEIPLRMSYVVTEMFLDYKGKLISQDKIFFDDLYNIAFKEGTYSSQENSKFETYKIDDVFIIKQKCADGAGFYEITWVIMNGKIVQRLIDEI